MTYFGSENMANRQLSCNSVSNDPVQLFLYTSHIPKSNNLSQITQINWFIIICHHKFNGDTEYLSSFSPPPVLTIAMFVISLSANLALFYLHILVDSGITSMGCIISQLHSNTIDVGWPLIRLEGDLFNYIFLHSLLANMHSSSIFWWYLIQMKTCLYSIFDVTCSICGSSVLTINIRNFCWVDFYAMVFLFGWVSARTM